MAEIDEVLCEGSGSPTIHQAGCSAVGSATPSLLPTSKYVLSAAGPSIGSRYVFRAVIESASHTQMAASAYFRINSRAYFVPTTARYLLRSS